MKLTMAHSSGERRRRVLIVDDDPVFALLAAATLEQAGFAAPVAHGPAEALALLEREEPDLLLLDVELPGVSGFDLCARIRATPAGVDVPIIMVTGNDDTASIARAYEVGATDFINKPVLWPILPHRVGFLLRARDNIHALRASEHKNRALLQALPDSIYIIDRDGVILEHITGSSGTAGTTLVGRRIEAIVPADVADSARQSMRAAGGSGEVIAHEFEVGGGGDRRA